FSGSYLCDPFVLQTNTGRLLVSMSVYSNQKNQNLSMIFRSDDAGETWQYLCELLPCYWGKMFCHKNRIYMLSISNEYGHAMLGYSEDEGEHWSQPVILFPGSSNYSREPGLHTSPGRICRYKGRIWMAMEYGSWSLGFHDSSFISVPEDADLMKGENWSMSEPLRFNTGWEGARKDGGLNYIEGNVIPGPDGVLYNILRNNNNDGRIMGNLGKAVILKIDTDNPEKKQEFITNIDFNGGTTKFVIDRDEKTGIYYSIVNRVTDPSSAGQRNIASLAISGNLRQWKFVKDFLNASDEAPEEVGFQYIYHIALGDDLLFVSRTACNHAHTYHDSNCVTFHREKNFRQLLEL
ncbi:MAG: glycoside hydrolase, partial [Treponema sp.]|nr:glycoside hydrolase [Treponema sp.]